MLVFDVVTNPVPVLNARIDSVLYCTVCMSLSAKREHYFSWLDVTTRFKISLCEQTSIQQTWNASGNLQLISLIPMQDFFDLLLLFKTGDTVVHLNVPRNYGKQKLITVLQVQDSLKYDIKQDAGAFSHTLGRTEKIIPTKIWERINQSLHSQKQDSREKRAVLKLLWWSFTNGLKFSIVCQLTKETQRLIETKRLPRTIYHSGEGNGRHQSNFPH